MWLLPIAGLAFGSNFLFETSKREQLMSVYIISQVTVHNREEYDIYSDQFMDVFQQFDGKLLSVDEEPRVLLGDWNATRSVLIEFPSEESAMAWMTSDDYERISKHRNAGATLNSILVKSLG